MMEQVRQIIFMNTEVQLIYMFRHGVGRSWTILSDILFTTCRIHNTVKCYTQALLQISSLLKTANNLPCKLIM